MGRLIDSSVCIAVERGLVGDAALANSGEEGVALAAITASELLVGVLLARPAARAAARQRFVDSLLRRFDVIPFDLDVARAHAELTTELRQQSLAIGEHDLQIAATARYLDWEVVTRDRRSFPRIPGLKVVLL